MAFSRFFSSARTQFASNSLWKIPTNRFAAVAKTQYASAEDLNLLRNIGISAHIDSGKTTTTERILFYTGRINAIHEVRGKDGVGAKMDSMELEKLRGITIKSAATHTQWGDHHINIIDTPGHVDFTIEVERSLQVLDGAIMIVCASSGVQSQTLTVDRQMKRYNVPRICFINKCDRIGANPFGCMDEIKSELGLNVGLLQIPMGLEDEFEGIVDLIKMKALYFEGEDGIQVTEKDIPEKWMEQAEEYRWKMLEALGEVDDDMANMFLEGEYPDTKTLTTTIRRLTMDSKFVPVFVGSATKNKGVQPVLDAVVDYLPSPLDKTQIAYDPRKEEGDPDRQLALTTNKKDPLLFIAFKLEEQQYGQLTWVRIYQGSLKRGTAVIPNNLVLGGGKAKFVKVGRLVRMHSDEIQDIEEARAGDICAMFGVECQSGTTFSDGKLPHVISDLHVPQTVVSMTVNPVEKKDFEKFGKAFERFMREDPTFKVTLEKFTNKAIFHGMGELHLQIYVERILREYGIHCEMGKPRVNYKESITQKKEFFYTHKRQSGGRGQFARIIGYIEPLDGCPNPKRVYEFRNDIRGQAIPKEYIKSVEEGFRIVMERGPMVGGPLEGMRVVLQDGLTHEVDSSDYAFQQAAIGCFQECIPDLGVKISTPYMNAEVVVPKEFQQTVISDLISRGAAVNDAQEQSRDTVIKAYLSLDNMFGYATDLRSMTQGKGTFVMEYADHQFVSQDVQRDLNADFLAKKKAGEDI